MHSLVLSLTRRRRSSEDLAKTKEASNPLPKNENGAPISEWEVRPGGMLVQQRGIDSSFKEAPTIRVRVKHGDTYHEIHINSQSTFGELKKKLVAPTGLHHQDQKLLFKDKERKSNAFLDVSGVKDRSKIVVMEDPISREKRFLEILRSSKIEKASKSILEISLEVDKLTNQVSALESLAAKGVKIMENDIASLTELLMNQLLKLDEIVCEGDVKSQRKVQVKRVQKYVEKLDLLKMKNINPTSNGCRKKQSTPEKISPAVSVTTTKWETFDSTPPSSSASLNPRFKWEFFD